ncbi:MAG: hypothetical protein ABSC37_12215 [Xanthobacteraceae bacterium]|jgi:hypothetical protein
MKITARGIVACVSLVILALASIGATSFAQTPTKSLKDQLVGHWQLVSVTVNGRTPYGDTPHSATPQGSMFLDAGGHYSVIVISTGNARSISYFGTYTVDDTDNSITMHIDASSGANAGRDVKRQVTFSGDELIVANQPPAQTPAGPLGGVKLTWKQAN